MKLQPKHSVFTDAMQALNSRVPYAPPVPANDNFRYFAANDNLAGAGDSLLTAQGRRQFAMSALKTGVRLPLKFFFWLGIAAEVAYFLWENQDDIVDYIQGPYDARPLCSGWASGIGNVLGYYNLAYINCPVGLQAVTTPTTYPTSNSASVSLMEFTNPGINRWTAIASWSRRSGFSGQQLRPQNMPLASPLIPTSPYVNPLYTPIRAPNYAPAKHYFLSPRQQANRDALFEEISPVPLPPIVIQPIEHTPDPDVLNINSPTPMRTQIGLDGRRDLPANYRSAPPPKGTKEHKLKLSATGITALAINIATETADVVDALFFAFPRAMRPKWENGKMKKLGLPDKMRFIYDNFEEIPVEQAIKNLIANQIEDKVYGKLGKAVGKTNEIRGTATSGFQYMKNLPRF